MGLKNMAKVLAAYNIQTNEIIYQNRIIDYLITNISCYNLIKMAYEK